METRKLNNKAKEVQHGDISLHFLDKIPDSAKKISIENNIFILAVGESSFHQHQLVGTGFEVFEDDKGVYVKVNRPTGLEHFDINTKQKAEHNTITIQPGIYIKRHEQSFNPFDEQINRTID